MGEHREVVIRQAKLLLAEEWAKWVKSLHSFDTRKCMMAYDTHTEDGSVIDTEYNDGRIERKQDGKLLRTFGENQLYGDELISQWESFGPNVEIDI